MNLQVYRAGTGFGNGFVVKIKLTHRDLVILAGIVVALIIALTTVFMEFELSKTEVTNSIPSLIKSTPAPKVLVKKLGQSLFNR
jgi:hypothetical protein